MSTIASIIVLAIFVAGVIIVFTNFIMQPKQVKLILRKSGWLISVKRIWWDTCETRAEAQEFCNMPLPGEYPITNKDVAEQIINSINAYLKKNN